MAFRRMFALVSLLLVGAAVAQAQDSPQRRGRKYKVPEETSHITVVVMKGQTGKPILNAAVVFHPVKDGKDEGNLEVKTNDDGKAIIDVIPTGSTVGVQVIADGYATYAGEYVVAEADREIQIKMIRPREQVSTYQDTRGKASQRVIGVQEPKGPSSDPVIQTPKPTNHTSDPNPTAPVDPNATPGNSQNNQTIPPKNGVPPQ